jgi:cytoskeleton protein RodZ
VAQADVRAVQRSGQSLAFRIEMPEIGATLREARMRERIDVSEIEAKTKIRAKYLRALENEEWDLLPGPTFVKSFLRTYAQALGLDDKALLEEYKLQYEHPRDAAEFAPQPTTASRRARARGQTAAPRRSGGAPRAGPSRGYVVAVGVIGVLIVLLVVGLLSGGGSPSSPASTQARRPLHSVASGSGGAGRRRRQTVAKASVASLKLEPTAEVYVCLIGDGGRKRIPGVILKPSGATTEPEYHARRFLLTLGNNAVTLIVNGKSRPVPASSGAIGYAITSTGIRSLASAEQPTCT